MLPRVTPQNEHFWRGGAAGELRFLRCNDCGTWIHPPQPVCPTCLSKNLAPEAVSGRGTVASYTINHQAWIPDGSDPYVIAIVEIAEVPEVRLMTNLVNCAPEAVRCDMPVRVVFEARDDDVYIPLFEPDAG